MNEYEENNDFIERWNIKNKIKTYLTDLNDHFKYFDIHQRENHDLITNYNFLDYTIHSILFDKEIYTSEEECLNDIKNKKELLYILQYTQKKIIVDDLYLLDFNNVPFIMNKFIYYLSYDYIEFGLFNNIIYEYMHNVDIRNQQRKYVSKLMLFRKNIPNEIIKHIHTYFN